MSKLAAIAAAAATLLSQNSDLNTSHGSGVDPRSGPTGSQLEMLSAKLSLNSNISLSGLETAATAGHLLSGALNLTFAANGANTPIEQQMFTTGARHSFTTALLNPDAHGSHILAEAGLAKLETIKSS